MIHIKIKKILKRYDDVFNGIVDKIKKIDDDWLEYSKNYMKIKFNSDLNSNLIQFTIKQIIRILQYDCYY